MLVLTEWKGHGAAIHERELITKKNENSTNSTLI